MYTLSSQKDDNVRLIVTSIMERITQFLKNCGSCLHCHHQIVTPEIHLKKIDFKL